MRAIIAPKSKNKHLVTWEPATKHTLKIGILTSGRRPETDIYLTKTLKGNWLANYKHFTFIFPGQAIRPGIAQTASIMPESSMQGFMYFGKYIINHIFNLSQHSYTKQYK